MKKFIREFDKIFLCIEHHIISFLQKKVTLDFYGLISFLIVTNSGVDPEPLGGGEKNLENFPIVKFIFDHSYKNLSNTKEGEIFTLLLDPP